MQSVKTLEMLMSEIYVLPILNKYTDLIDLKYEQLFVLEQLHSSNVSLSIKNVQDSIVNCNVIGSI